MATNYCSGWWQGCWPQSGFGFGSSDSAYSNGLHPGIDLGLPFGTPVYAAEPATVVFAGWMAGLGNAVILTIDGTQQIVFGHLSHLNVKRGDQLGPGGLLGLSGNSGNSTGNHLHFETRTGSGAPIDPLAWLKNHLDTVGFGGSAPGKGINPSGPTGNPVQGSLDIPGAIASFATSLTKSLSQVAYMVLGLILFIVGLWLTVKAEGGKLPMPAHVGTPLRVIKGAKEAVA